MEQEPQFSPEQENSEPTVGDITRICVEAIGKEVAEDFENMEPDEAMGYAYTLLIENDLDPDKIFKQYGLTFGF